MIEKIQVEVAAAAAMVFMFFVGWRAFLPAQVDGALVFLPTGSIGSLVTFAGIVWLMAAAMAILTISARSEGAALALLAGVAAAAMRTAPMRHLVNRFEDSIPSLMASLAVEILCLAVILLVAVAIIGVVRQGLSYVLPSWMQPASTKATATDPARAQVDRPEKPPLRFVGAVLALVLGFGFIRTDLKSYIMSLPSVTGRDGKQPSRELAVSILSSFGLTLLAGLVLMMITLRATGSVDRGQIIFSLAISFFAAAWAVSWFFPAGFSLPYWLAPMVLAIVIYIRACGVAPDPPVTWSQIEAMAHILPIDWLGAGCGGAIGGYWISCRLREQKVFAEAQDKDA